MTPRLAVPALLLSFTLSLSAASIGELQVGGGTTASAADAAVTFVNSAFPALAPGTIANAHVLWGEATCAGSLKIKIIRPGEFGSLRVSAERGPFTPIPGPNVFTLTPPIEIRAGDMIGVTQLGPACGGGILRSSVDRNVVETAIFGEPALGSSVTTEFPLSSRVPNVAGSNSPDLLHGYVIAAGSLRGGFGSQFKTGLQLANNSAYQIKGKLVFHPAGVPAQATDPFLLYSIPARRTVSYDDVVQVFGVSGLGTIDLFTSNGAPPNVTVRIYNDNGAAGTSGLTEELKTPYEIIESDQGGTLSIPADVTNFRLNIGYRTLDEGAQLNVQVYDKDGVLVPGTEAQVFPANTFNQVSGAQFTGRAALPAGGLITFQVTSGSIYVYGATTDNRTNDGNLAFATKY